jgi:hypothetical protein
VQVNTDLIYGVDDASAKLDIGTCYGALGTATGCHNDSFPTLLDLQATILKDTQTTIISQADG